MGEEVLIGRKREILRIPYETWAQHHLQPPQHADARLRFMSPEHHRLRYFAVTELVRRGQPIQPEAFSQALEVPLPKVETLLDELERKLFFLVRNEHGAVFWAYPVTVEPTPHRLQFSTGEQLYAAWAEDALAAPFVQGQLRQQDLTVTIATSCGHCDRPMELTVSSDMAIVSPGEATDPLVFMPDVDWETFAERTIIDTYWRNSLFFWSEEHAQEHRSSRGPIDGIYLTLKQAAYVIPIAQSALFAFG